MRKSKSSWIWIVLLSLAEATQAYAKCNTGDAACVDKDFKRVCGDVIDKKGNPVRADVPQEKVDYCVAAKQAKPVLVYNSVAAPLFLTGAALCFAACAEPYLSNACSGSSTVLSAADTATTGFFASKGEEMHKIMAANTAISATGTAFGGIRLMAGLREGATEFEKGTSRKEYVDAGKAEGASKDAQKAGKDAKGAAAMNCITGIMLTAQAAMKIAGAVKAQEVRINNIEKARKYVSDTPPPLPDPQFTTTSPDAGNGGGGTGGRGAGGGDFSDGEFEGGKNDPVASCASVLSTGSSSALSGCGKGSDAAIGGLLDSGLGENFKQLTGQDIGDFIKDFNSSGQSAAGALGNMLGGDPDAKSLIASVLGDVEKEGLKEGAVQYASLGGGDSGGGGGPDVGKAMGEALAKLFDPLNPKKDQAPGMTDAKFGSNGRAPAGNEIGDPQTNLFERVSKRYQFTRGRVAQLPWSSHYNRVSHH